MQINGFFGPLYAPYSKVLISSSKNFKNIVFKDLAELSELDPFDFDCIFLIAMDYRNFIQQIQQQFHSSKTFNNFMKIKKRKLILCDSIKTFWQQFVRDYGNFFTEIYSIDMPFNDYYITESFRNHKSIYGIPLLDRYHNTAIDIREMKLLSFAGTIDIYPERLEFLEELENKGIKIHYLHNLHLKNRYDEISFEEYMDFQLKSIFAINFPTIPARQGAFNHIKGRYWECLATGTKIIEKYNPLIRNIPIQFEIFNYSQIDDIRKLMDVKWDLEQILEEKREKILKYDHYFIPRNFFEQFDIELIENC